MKRTSPNATLYQSGHSICTILEYNKDHKYPVLKGCKQEYQNIVRSIGWLAHSTCPDLAATHSFLAIYSNKTMHCHWNAVLYALQYIHSTINNGINFTSKGSFPLHAFMHLPHSSNTEAYHNSIPPQDGQHHCFTTYSNACWGSQLQNAVHEEIQLPLFKFPSMSSTIVMWSGGQLSWKANRQDRTSLSSCKAEIRAINIGCQLAVYIRHVISSLSSLGYPITNAEIPIPLYNNNDACIK
jgi:hypothetical protein